MLSKAAGEKAYQKESWSDPPGVVRPEGRQSKPPESLDSRSVPSRGRPARPGQGSLSPLLEETGDEDRELMPLQALGAQAKPEYQRFRPMEILVDSGAAASVMPERLLDGFTVRKGEAARNDVHYTVADGGKVPNLGETEVHILTRERARGSIVFQVADIQKPILAVSALTKQGNAVSFTETGGTIRHLRTGRTMHFRKVRGVYVLKVLAAPPSPEKQKEGAARGSLDPSVAGQGSLDPSAKAEGASGFTRQGRP